MLYSSARPQIRSGDLLAWGHERWGSWYDLKVQAVRMFTRSEYAHAAVAWVVGGRVLVVEAVVPCVRVFPLSRLLPCYWLANESRKLWTDDLETLALSKLGEPYSQWEAIRAFLGRVKKMGADKVWECAELAEFIRAPLTGGNVFDPTPTNSVRDALLRGANLELLTGG